MAFTKQELITKMEAAGDACIHFKSAISGKDKYVVGTLEFQTKYVADKLKNLKTTKPKSDDSVLIFSWDTDSFKQIDPGTVTRVEPLSFMIPNDPC